ncbi:methyltransferase family protein [Nocardioides albertanoniae]|uniref:Methyltransferase family protein n=1 Tax=Nocardioides albertanoniae TaxID=1175486 RepID=A0A543A6B1_9ACTN|nr:class I SAM-dependent methyltransferase [Nocardioides albertanoniae]TQL68108.1 methyltransferase family protein [Nocardioides albertanoniae]
MTSSDVWDREAAERYDDPADWVNSSEVTGPVARFLAEVADGGPALELAIGTGRIGVPLRELGVPVTGIELSRPMVDVLRRKVTADEIPVVVGDMAAAEAPGMGTYAVVYLVYNTIGNLRTQDEQVECFANAARHLAPGGRFVIEVGVPGLRRLPPGSPAIPFDVSPAHLGFDTYDLVTQQAISHHYTRVAEDHYRYSPHNFRFVWPAELDLMARLAGMSLEARYGGWDRSPFTSESPAHVSVWRKPV